MTGRPRTCECGKCHKCLVREKSRLRYQALSQEERRALVARRDIVKVRERDRVRYRRPKELQRLSDNTKRWRLENPEKWSAQKKVAYAIKTGRLTKEKCEKCEATYRVHAHHDDYSKPLEVRWLCPLHHAEER